MLTSNVLACRDKAPERDPRGQQSRICNRRRKGGHDESFQPVLRRGTGLGDCKVERFGNTAIDMFVRCGNKRINATEVVTHEADRGTCFLRNGTDARPGCPVAGKHAGTSFDKAQAPDVGFCATERGGCCCFAHLLNNLPVVVRLFNRQSGFGVMGDLSGAFRHISSDEVDPDADWSLPGWLYTDPEHFAFEMQRVIRPSRQIVCHEGDIAAAGEYRTLDYLNESVIAIRGDDGVIRAFTNVCRHRAMRLVEGPAGCARKLVCPYHAWTFEPDGRLSGVPMKSDYPALKLEDNGLVPVAVEIWRGFVFVRLVDAGFPSVAEMMAPFEEEVEPYRFEDMRRIGDVRLRES